MIPQSVQLTASLSEERFRGKRLTFMPWLDSITGYCIHATQLFRHWEKMGVFVSVRPVFTKECEEAKIPMDMKRAYTHRDQMEPWQLVLSPASYRPANRRKEVLWTMYESNRWTPKQVKLLNRAEAVVVPCEWNRQGLRESGIIRPVFKVPLGFADETFKFTPMDLSGPCVFGTAGRQSHGVTRKGMSVVINAFLQEFPNEQDVRLHVKGLPDVPTKFVYDRRVIVRDRFLREAQLSEWFSELTCFVSAARGEGFGLMQLESMAVGRPVIASIYGGLAEFMTAESSYPVDFTEAPSTEAWQNGGMWAVPDERHIRSLMRRVYNNREEARQKGLVAARQVSGFTWRASAVKCLEVLEQLGAL